MKSLARFRRIRNTATTSLPIIVSKLLGSTSACLRRSPPRRAPTPLPCHRSLATLQRQSTFQTATGMRFCRLDLLVESLPFPRLHGALPAISNNHNSMHRRPRPMFMDGNLVPMVLLGTRVDLHQWAPAPLRRRALAGVERTASASVVVVVAVQQTEDSLPSSASASARRRPNCHPARLLSEGVLPLASPA